jgi:hypothetical protein
MLTAWPRLVVAGVITLALLQLIRPGIPDKPDAAQLRAPLEVRGILEKDCSSCHSDRRRLAWFDQIVPAYWLVRHDVLTARERLNFSTLGTKPAATQTSTLYEAVNMIQLGAMPLPRFVRLHPEARVSSEELATLKAWLAPWSTPPGPAPATPAEIVAAPTDLAAVQPEFNGLPFDPSFESWKPISITDRGDNDTFRFILGNDVAVEAAESGNILPWPEGARFAKIAWQQQPGADGLIHPGKFVQVELMVKGSHRYEDTEGWGWGRWRGLDLKPYGKNAAFVNECTGCHLPVRGNDYVYTLPISSAKIGREEVVNNAAALPASLPYRPSDWRAITMYVDPRSRTMAMLYGNDKAMESAKGGSTGGAKGVAYPSGAILALVTWKQRDDPHWFGGRMPDAPLAVEFVGVEGQTSSYRRFTGGSLDEVHPTETMAAQRTSFVLGLIPAQLP